MSGVTLAMLVQSISLPTAVDRLNSIRADLPSEVRMPRMQNKKRFSFSEARACLPLLAAAAEDLFSPMLKAILHIQCRYLGIIYDENATAQQFQTAIHLVGAHRLLLSSVRAIQPSEVPEVLGFKPSKSQKKRGLVPLSVNLHLFPCIATQMRSRFGSPVNATSQRMEAAHQHVKRLAKSVWTRVIAKEKEQLLDRYSL